MSAYLWPILATVGMGGIIVLLLLAAWFCSIIWAADEPDVNGDPERDAGYTDDEIATMAKAWDGGSARTAEGTSVEDAAYLQVTHHD